MAYWGPPFIDEADQARFACFAAIDMIGRIATLREELPELLGARTIHRYRRGIGRQHRLRIYDELHRYEVG
jgi:hypothetical protein